MKDKKLYKKALYKWGQYAQMDIMVEECAELIKAFMKYRRYPNNPVVADNVCEEMVDVEIMIEQWKLIFGKHDFNHIKEAKLKRLESLINDSQL